MKGYGFANFQYSAFALVRQSAEPLAKPTIVDEDPALRRYWTVSKKGAPKSLTQAEAEALAKEAEARG